MDVLGELSEIRAERAALDVRERLLIEAARDAGAGWARIAEALGLASRQAAEQRLLRLSGESGRDAQAARQGRQKQRSVDKASGEALGELRKAVRTALREIGAPSGWDGSHVRAALARQTLETAVAAPPGSLYELAGQALSDLDAMGEVRIAGRLRSALQAAGS